MHKKNGVRHLRENFDNDIQKGFIDINGHKVIIKFHNKRTNDLLTSRVSNSDTIDKKTEALHKKEHYKIIIPIELFCSIKPKTI